MNHTRLWWGVTSCWCLVVLVIASQYASSAEGLGLMITALVLAISWLGRLAVLLHHRQARPVLCSEGIAICATLLLAISPVPQNLRFRLSEPALTAYVRQPREGKNITVGLYPFKSIHQTEEGWLFLLGESGLTTQSGFLYHRGPAPEDNKLHHYKRLSGSWYLWTYDAF